MGRPAARRPPTVGTRPRDAGLLVVAALLQAACLIATRSPAVAAELANLLGSALIVAGSARAHDDPHRRGHAVVAEACGLVALGLAAGVGSYAVGRLAHLDVADPDPQLIASAGAVGVAACVTVGQRRQAASGVAVILVAAATAAGLPVVDPLAALCISVYALHRAWRYRNGFAGRPRQDSNLRPSD